MAVPFTRSLSTGAELLATILSHKPDLIDQLALCLDRKMRLIPNWKDLARKLKVDGEVITKLEQCSDLVSPTIRLFDYLEVTQPKLNIQQLRDALVVIKRNDLSLRLTKAECADTDKVQEVITSRDKQAPSHRAGLLDEIALALDGRSRVLGNWFNLAMSLGVKRDACWKFETRLTQSPTIQLFQYLETKRPQMTLKELKEALDSMTRNDLLQVIETCSIEDETPLKDIMTPGSKLLQIMADKLNREQPAIENWRDLASKLGIPGDVIRAFSSESTWQNGNSPTKEVLGWVAAQFPDTTVKDVVKALDTIQRNDAIQIITKRFPDTVVSSLEQLGSSSNEPKCETLPSRDKKEECGSLPKREKVTRIVKQPGHCGNLPDPTYLVGREETCEQIVKILDQSNEAVEVVAPPGYGKTSVVVEVAHRMIQSGKFVVYVKTRRVTCVEDLGSRIIEALGAVSGEDTIRETLRRIRVLEANSVVLIIENIDNLLHLEDQVSNQTDRLGLESPEYCAKMRGKYKKDDFLTFLKDIGKSPNIHLVLTSREKDDFSVSFPIELIELQPLSDEDSATLLRKRGKGLGDDLVKNLVRVCGGIPLVICTVLAIVKRENQQDLCQRFSNATSPCSLFKELNLDYIADEDRMDRCLQVCFNRLGAKHQDALLMMSTFPHRFTKEQFLAVFESLLSINLEKCLSCLKHSTLLRFDQSSCHHSLHPFMRDYFSLMPKHAEFKSVFIRHYSDLAVTLCKQFLSQHSKAAIDCYSEEKENIREAIAWCGDNHDHDVDQKTREHCIHSFNTSAVFLAKMMRKQEFESLFCKLSQQCCYNRSLYSACLTHIGMKVVLSCTCTPHICPRALYRAKVFLSYANDFHKDIKPSGKAFDDSTRAQCMSKLGFCFVREGHVELGYSLLNQAVLLRRNRMKQSKREEDKVMLAACHNDLAASQTIQCKHMAAIEIRLNSVLPDYESILGDHVFVATTLNWIGVSYQALGDYDNAIKYTKRALEIRERLLGHHQETARSLYDLGVAYSAMKDYESALQYLQNAAALQEEVLDTHEELILTHQAMAVALSGLGRHEEAKKEMDLAADSAKKVESLDVPSEIHKSRVVKASEIPVSVPVRSSEQGKKRTRAISNLVNRCRSLGRSTHS